MKELFFWKNWYKSQQYLYIFLLGIFGLSALIYTYTYFVGNELIIPWEVKTTLNPTKQVIDEVNIGIFNIPIEGEMFVFEEKFKAGLLKIPIWIYTTYSLFLLFAIIVLLSVLSTLKQIPYLLGMGVFIFFLSTLNLDFLGVFQAKQNILLIISLVAYLGLSFYFQYFQKNASLFARILSFSLLSLGLGLWIGTQAKVNFPLVYLVNYGMVIPILLTFVFISITSHDILFTFFQLIVRYNPQGGQSNLIHFSIFSVIYLLNVFLLYLDYFGYLYLNLIYIDIYWLFLISAILGIWGFQKRNVLIQQFLPFAPQGALVYLSLGVLAFSTLAFGFATANDALMEAFRDFMLFSYLAFGVVFYLYIILNFGDLMASGLAVDKIAYEGKALPFNTLRYFGFVMIVGLVITNRQMLYYQTLGGYYNGIGDTYYAHRDYHLAKINYEQALANDFLNHHSNYAMASLYDIEKNYSEESFYLKNGMRRQISEQSLLRFSDLLYENERTLDALFQLREGSKKKPNSLKINNNLALLFAENKVIDSAFYYLDKAEKSAGYSTVSQNNMWAFLADKSNNEARNLQNLPILKNEHTNWIGRINKLALYNKNRTNLNFSVSPEQKVSLEQNFAHLYNQALNKIIGQDSSMLAKIRSFDKTDKNKKYSYQTQFIEACTQYYGGNVETGIQLIAGIPIIPKDSYYNTVLGLWFLEQQNFGNAQSYFEKAIDLGNQQAYFYLAIALSEAGDFQKAGQTWIQVIQHAEQPKENKQLAHRILKVLTDSVQIDDDVDRYNLIHYKRRILPHEVLENLYGQMTDKKFKIKASADLINHFVDYQELSRANKIYQSIKLDNSMPVFSKSEFNYAYLRLLMAQKEYAKILQKIDKLSLINYHKNKKLYFRAFALAQTGKNQESEKYFSKAVLAAPFDEEVIMNTAEFYRQVKKSSEKAYQILVNGVRGNAFSLPMYKAYTLQCLEVGLDNYGDIALAEIKKNVRAEEYAEFEKIYLERKKLLLEKRNPKTS